MSDATPPLLPGQKFDVQAAEKALTYQAIVRELARSAVIDSHPDGYRWCVLCDAGTEDGDVPHTETCLWRRAREVFPDG